MEESARQLESVIAFLVPEADPVIGPWRQRYDPSAAQGVPAHVTLLYPFKPPQLLTNQVVVELASFLASWPALDLHFAGLCAFPDVLYLAPEPQTAIVSLIEALAARYPETPPYGGRFALAIPHLTIAQPADSKELPFIAAEFSRSVSGSLPIVARVEEVQLLTEVSVGAYERRATFRLRSG